MQAIMDRSFRMSCKRRRKQKFLLFTRLFSTQCWFLIFALLHFNHWTLQEKERTDGPREATVKRNNSLPLHHNVKIRVANPRHATISEHRPTSLYAAMPKINVSLQYTLNEFSYPKFKRTKHFIMRHLLILEVV